MVDRLGVPGASREGARKGLGSVLSARVLGLRGVEIFLARFARCASGVLARGPSRAGNRVWLPPLMLGQVSVAGWAF